MKIYDWALVLHYVWPVILIPVGWIISVRLGRARTASGASMMELQEQHLTETYRMSAAMERIAAVLEKSRKD